MNLDHYFSRKKEVTSSSADEGGFRHKTGAIILIILVGHHKLGLMQENGF